ncbi:Methyltransferase domain-containing protein [Devosia crocina]|uniref:Methyltransferase domain-containing protein n=1 Tax=Devosia crocina TaxID=429728 RepID=A0A1I7NQN3_9HYPH|nr:class I SAM-dependent methyltransferase [Devosia crocina]SFV36997.1 Methyltransferase domain-containing protein [Devosia crocina]
MAQNIYDDAAFFEGYSQISRSRLGLAGAPEWSDVEAMLPDLDGLSVLDLGCGFGAFPRYAIERGAARVHGVDLSQNMLRVARERSGTMPITFEQANLETYEPEAGAFDLVYSALAIHYLADFDRFCAMVVRALGPGGGNLVITTEHPIWAARAEPDFRTDPDGTRVFAITDYGVEGQRTSNWITDGIVKYHRKLSTLIMTMHRHGLMLRAIEEWTATGERIAQNPALIDEKTRPQLLLMAAHRAPETDRN